LANAVVLVKRAGIVHADPRPFVVDPSIKPLFERLDELASASA